MANFTREYERVTCPECNRTISAYVPHFGDGTGLRVVTHNRLPRHGRSVSCPASGRIVVRERGRRRWRIDP